MKKTFTQKNSNMKNSIYQFAAVMIILMGINNTANAQIASNWQGGTPGRTSEWNCASNWKEGKVPNEFSNVFIAINTNTPELSPRIDQTEIVINTLVLLPGAVLNISNNGGLEVIDSISVYGNANIHNQGELISRIQQTISIN